MTETEETSEIATTEGDMTTPRKPTKQKILKDLKQDITSADSLRLEMVAKVEIRGTPEEVKALREKLEAWVRECSSTGTDREDTDDLVSYTGLLAFYPQRNDS